jgi:hypothetical protein
MLQWLYTYVANFYSQCFICFPDVCCKCVYLDVAYVSHICCKYYIWTLHMFLQRFQVVFASVLDACFKYFICLQTNVGSVAPKYFKSRSGVASISSPSAATHRCLLLLSASVGHLPPLPLFSMLLTLEGRHGPRVDARNVRENTIGAGVWTACPFGRWQAQF